jgi:hypothetical protein
VQQARPPFIRFEVRPIEDRAASITAGYYVTKDVDFIILVPHGSEGKQSIEQPYGDWLKKIKPLAGGDLMPSNASFDTPAMAAARFPAEWLEKIEAGYKAWKEGRELPIEGTPLDNWPVLSPSQRINAKQMHLLTVEDLAAASDEACQSVGIGGITLRQRARDWLEAKKADPAKIAAQMESLQVQLKDLAAANEALRLRNQLLEAQAPAKV